MTNFQIIPAIDIKDGKCVRLLQGDYNQVNEYSDSPVTQAGVWYSAGAELLHIVDLDAAKDGSNANHKIVFEIQKRYNKNIEIGGWIRDITTVEKFINAGIKYVIIGTAAVKSPEFLEVILKRYPKHITVGIDAKNEYIATDGWLNSTKLHFLDFAKKIASIGCRRIIFTDISRDGMLSAPNFEATCKLAQAVSEYGCSVIASGGVAKIDDIIKSKAPPALLIV